MTNQLTLGGTPIKLNEERQKVIDSWIKQDKTSRRFLPEYGEEYWLVSGKGSIHSDFWGNLEVDKDRFSIGNVYRTQEDTQKAIDKLKARVTIDTFIDEQGLDTNVDWEDFDQVKYFIMWNCDDNEIDYDWNKYYKYNDLPAFKTQEDIKKLYEAHPEECKLLLGVE